VTRQQQVLRVKYLNNFWAISLFQENIEALLDATIKQNEASSSTTVRLCGNYLKQIATIQ